MTPDDGHPERTSPQIHLYANGISLRHIYENLLLELRYTRLSDAQNFLGILVLFRDLLENNLNHEECSIYLMSQGDSRERSLNDQSEILNLFQGAYPVYPKEIRGSIYPGDRFIHSADNITIQIHMLNIIDLSKRPLSEQPIPTIAIYIPPRLWSDILIQDQGGVESNGE